MSPAKMTVQMNLDKYVKHNQINMDNMKIEQNINFLDNTADQRS